MSACGVSKVALKVRGKKGHMSTMRLVPSAGKRTSMVPNYGLSRAVCLLSVILGLLPLLWVSISQGQTTSLTSSGLGTTISPASIDPAGRPNYIITGGTRPGDGPNLFHSFGDFSVGTNNVARFFNETGRSTTNILSRVTGGQTSNIYGTIQTAGFGTAALWLINPAGIVFGPSASLNVGGSVHFGTADYLRLGSGNDRFYADLGKTSQLTSAAVTAFGFLSERPAGPVTVRAGSPLAVSEGKVIDLIGGDISITERTVSAPDGQINLASVSGAGEVIPNQLGETPSLGLANVSKLGTIQLTEGAILRTSSNTGDAGPVLIRSGRFVMENAGIEAITTAPSPGPFVPQLSGGIVDILSNTIVIKGGAVQTELGFGTTFPVFARDPGTSKASGLSILTNNQGDITLASSDVTLDNAKIVSYGQQVVSSLAGSATGQIQIRGMQGAQSLADQVTISNKSLLHTAGTASDCDCIVLGRDVSIQTNNLDIADSRLSTTQGIVSVFAENELFSRGGNTFEKDGSVQNLRANQNDIELTAGKRISLGQGDFIAGKLGGGLFALPIKGDVVIKAPVVSMSGTTVEANGDTIVRGGDIAIRADETEITGSRFSTNGLGGTPVPGSGTAGSIKITGMQDGVKAETITLVKSTVESLVTQAGSNLGVFGNSGSIILEGNNVLLDGSTVSVTHGGAGQSGSIIVNVGSLTLTNGSNLTSAASGKDFSSGSTLIAAAPGGPISIQGNEVQLIKGSGINASSTGDGSAGTVTIRGTNGPGSAENLVTLDNSTISTTISGGSPVTVPATIDLAGEVIRLANGSRITADTSGEASAGNIHLDTADFAASNGAMITSSSTGTGTSAGSAGQILIGGIFSGPATNISLDNSSISTTISGGTLTTSRANIDLSAQTIRLVNGARITADTSGDASAGDITLHAANVATSNGAKISSSSTSTGTSAGPAGGIVIEGPGESFAESVSLDNSSLSIILRGGDSEPIRGRGHISILARSISLENGTHIEADTSGGAFAGAILFQGSGSFAVSKGARITSTSTGTGHAGDILVGSGNVVIENSTFSTSATQASAGSIRLVAPSMVGLTNAQLTSTAESGKGGTIAIQSGDIAINNGSLVSTITTGANDAGNITLTSGTNILIANSTVSTSAAKASGGSIDLKAPNLVRLVGANLTSSVAGLAGSSGGNITIDTAHPQFVIMQGNSQILAKANEGQGGAITIIGGVVLQEPGSVLDATAGPAGISGSINIQAPFQQLAGAIAPLPQAFAVATNLYGQRCATEKGGQFSSFVQGARDGVPPQPGDLIPSPLLLEPDEAASNIRSQGASSLSAIRLGLPGFEQTSYSSLTVFSGCPS